MDSKLREIDRRVKAGNLDFRVITHAKARAFVCIFPDCWNMAIVRTCLFGVPSIVCEDCKRQYGLDEQRTEPL